MEGLEGLGFRVGDPRPLTLKGPIVQGFWAQRPYYIRLLWGCFDAKVKGCIGVLYGFIRLLGFGL